MRVTVGELRDEPAALAEDWQRQAAHLVAERSALVILPEMAFVPWFAAGPTFEATTWQQAVAAHDAWQARLAELAPASAPGGAGMGGDFEL